MQEWLRIEAVDLCITTPRIVKNMETIYLKKGRMLAVLPKGHRLLSYERVPLAEIACENYISLEVGRYSELQEVFKQNGCIPHTIFSGHDVVTITRMIEKGMGVSIISEVFYAGTNFDVELRETDPPIYRELALCCKQFSRLSIACKKFVKYLRKNLDQLP